MVTIGTINREKETRLTNVALLVERFEISLRLFKKSTAKCPQGPSTQKVHCPRRQLHDPTDTIVSTITVRNDRMSAHITPITYRLIPANLAEQRHWREIARARKIDATSGRNSVGTNGPATIPRFM
jgi:hypothetical protein